MNFYAIGIDLIPENGGPTKSVPNFARALGGRAISFTQKHRLPSVPGSEIEHIRSVAGPLGKAYLVAPPSEIRRLDRMTEQAELLSCHILYRHSAHWVVNRAKRRGIPYWVVPHGCLDPYVFSYGLPVKRLWMRLFGRRILREAAAVIFSTRREMEKAACWLDRYNAHVVHWPVELPDLRKGRLQRSQWRKAQGFRDTDKVLLSLGRLHTMKQPLQTVDAVAHAGQRNLHLVFVGPEGDVSPRKILSHAQNAGISDRVRILQPIYGQGKYDAIFGCDAYISLSLRENFNNSAAEALSAARPVILSTGNDLLVDLEPHGCNWPLPGDSTQAVGDALRRFATLGEDCVEELGSSARTFAEQHLSFLRFQTRLFQIAASSGVRSNFS